MHKNIEEVDTKENLDTEQILKLDNHEIVDADKTKKNLTIDHIERSNIYVTAIYPYSPRGVDEIELRTGEKIKVSLIYMLNKCIH